MVRAIAVRAKQRYKREASAGRECSDQEAMKRWILAAGVAAFLAEPCMAFMGSPLAQPSGMRPPAVVQQRRPRAFQVLFNGKEQQARRGHARNGACGDAWVQPFRVNGCAYFGWPSKPLRSQSTYCCTLRYNRCSSLRRSLLFYCFRCRAHRLSKTGGRMGLWHEHLHFASPCYAELSPVPP